MEILQVVAVNISTSNSDRKENLLILFPLEQCSYRILQTVSIHIHRMSKEYLQSVFFYIGDIQDVIYEKSMSSPRLEWYDISCTCR